MLIKERDDIRNMDSSYGTEQKIAFPRGVGNMEETSNISLPISPWEKSLKGSNLSN